MTTPCIPLNVRSCYSFLDSTLSPEAIVGLECHRLGIRLLPPDVNAPGPGFRVEGGAIRVPVSAIKGLTDRFVERLHTATGAFASLTDFSERVRPSAEEVELLIRAGAFDGLGLPRTRLFWEAQVCSRRGVHTQDWLLPPPPLDQLAGLKLAGLAAGQRILLMTRNRPEFHWFDLAAQFLRATPVSI